MSASLATLKVGDARLRPALSAAQSLADLLVRRKVQRTTRALVLAAAEPVDRITDYLANQAQVTRNAYRQAAVLDDTAWSRLLIQSGPDATFCAGSNLCRLTYRLGHRANVEEAAALRRKAAAADMARTAFLIVRRDHRLLADNARHLTASRVTDELRADQPDLQAAIGAVRGIVE